MLKNMIDWQSANEEAAGVKAMNDKAVCGKILIRKADTNTTCSLMYLHDWKRTNTIRKEEKKRHMENAIGQPQYGKHHATDGVKNNQ